MEFGTAELDKRELAVAAVAAIGFLTAGVGNRLGAQVLRADGVRGFPARSGRTHLLGLLRALLAAPRAAEPRANFGSTGLRSWPTGSPRVHRFATRRGLVVVVSDFLDGCPTTPASRRRGSGPCAGWPPSTRCSRSR